MVDVFSKEKRSEIMGKIHQPTKLEKKVHNQLCGRHIRHKMYPKIIGNPDIEIQASPPLYVFVDGCFWHCCPVHYRRPKTRFGFWNRHIEVANKKREEERATLPYRWIRVWEHEVEKDIKGVIETIETEYIR
mgnify:CR=1 FL=1